MIFCLLTSSCSRKSFVESPYVNVKSLGAYGDGLHDDTYVIQKAIRTASEKNLDVFFPEGTYIISKINKKKRC